MWLGSLVPKSEMPPGINVRYQSGELSQLSLTSPKVRQPANIFEWLRWFLVYASVFTQKGKDDLRPFSHTLLEL